MFEIDLRAGKKPKLEELLDKKEQLWQFCLHQEKIHPEASIVYFRLNVPGPYKNNLTIRKLFHELADAAKARVPLDPYQSYTDQRAITGPYGIWLYRKDAHELKEIFTAFEDEHPLGRFCDIDVLFEGENLSRKTPRTCFLCDQPAKLCGRSRAHSTDELLDHMEALLKQHLGKTEEESPAVSKALRPSTVMKQIEQRSSCRKFKAEALEKEELERLLKAALHAPTGMNLQNLRFRLISNSTLLKKISDCVFSELSPESKKRMEERGATSIFYGAPHVLVISSLGSAYEKVDAGIAVQTVCLLAEELGFASCIIAMAEPAFQANVDHNLRQELSFAENENFMISVALGFAEERKAPHEISLEHLRRYE